jgi:archaemetzincin
VIKRSSKILWSVLLLVLIGYLLLTIAGPESEKRRISPDVDPVGSLTSLSSDLKRAFEAADDFPEVPMPEPGDWLAQHDEPGQSYDQYLISFPNRPDALRSKIYLQPLGRLSDKTRDCLNLLVDYINVYFQIEAVVSTPMTLEEISTRTRINQFTGRRQLHAIDILGQLKPRVPEDAFCVLALTGEDLYPEDSWNYAFGYASFRERVGVYSFARYDPAFFGQPRSANFHQLFLRRSLQILTHEMTHMYSLKHCIYYHCVANGSNNLPESDAQPLHLCPVCLRKLHSNMGFNIVQRYRGLHEFYQKADMKQETGWVKDRLMWILDSESTIISGN